MTSLRPMRAETFPSYVEASIRGYAQDNVTAGRWAEKGSLERSREEFERILPEGMATPGNFLFEIVETDDGPPVGFVWYTIDSRHGSCTAYVYDIELVPAHQRKGHAFRALKAVESMAAAAGATSIGLNVFANNAGAQALYRKLGYMATNFNMRKRLGGTGA